MRPATASSNWLEKRRTVTKAKSDRLDLIPSNSEHKTMIAEKHEKMEQAKKELQVAAKQAAHVKKTADSAFDLLTKTIQETAEKLVLLESKKDLFGTKKRKASVAANKDTTIESPSKLPKCHSGEMKGKHQKLPLKMCVYRPEVKRFVYIPPGYGDKHHQKHGTKLSPAFCKQCRLQPCMNTEYMEEIYGLGWSLDEMMSRGIKPENEQAARGAIEDKIIDKLIHKVGEIMDKLYGVECAKNMKIPRCVWDTIHLTYSGSGQCRSFSHQGGESSDDDEQIMEPNKMLNPRHF